MSAIRHGTAPFPVGEVSTGAGNSALLGLEIQGVDGKEYRLVNASEGEAAPANKIFRRDSAGSTSAKVAIASSDACGVAVTGQAALAVGDYFWLQIAGEVTLIKTGTLGAGLLLLTGAAGAATNSASTGTTYEAAFPARAHTVVGTVVTAYLLSKLMG